MGEYAETQGQLRRGDKLRTWKVTRLYGEIRGRGSWAQGVRRQGRGRGARVARCAPLLHIQPDSCLCFLPWTCAHTAFAWCDSLSRAPEAGKGYLIFSSLASGGSGGRGSGGELSPSGDSSGFSRL